MTEDAKVSWIGNKRLLALLLFAFSCLLYANTLGHGYALDDAIVITDNFITQKGPAGWGELFGNDTFFGFFQDRDKLNLVSGGRYRPLSLAMFGLERVISDGPFIHHLFNLIWYGGVVVLLFLLLVNIQEHRSSKEKKYWIPLLAALLFAAHPIHTEVVANIKGRDELMALAASLSAAWLTWRAVEKENMLLAAMAGVCFFLGLLSKETTITFLAVVPLLLIVLRRDFRWEMLAYLTPIALATGLFLLIRASVLESGSGDPIMELMNNPFVKLENGFWVEFSSMEWMTTVLYGLWKYLELLFLPIQQSHDYYPRAFGMPSWGDWQVVVGLIANLALLTYGVLSLRKRPWLGAGILTYFFTLSIVANIFFPVGTLISERFLFFPSVGLAMSLMYFGYRSSNAGETKDGEKPLQSTSALSPLFLYGILALVLIGSVKTVVRNGVWKDNYTLFTTDVHHQPGSAKMQNAAAGSKVDRFIGLPEAQQGLPKNQQLLTEAVEHLNQALTVHPTYKQAFVIRGTAQLLAKNYDQAIQDFDHALVLDPGYEDAAKKLMITLRNAGQFYGETKGDLQRSQQYLQQALQRQPNDYESLRLMGVLNGVSGRKQQAIDFFRRAADANPNLADAWWNLGVAYYQNQQAEVAEQHFNKARQIEPGIDARKRGQ